MAVPGSNDPNPEIAGDGQQLQEFVRELTAVQGRIRAFIVSLMPGSPDVQDVLQETNLTLWKSRDRFRPGTNFQAWAFTISRLEVMHHRARAKRLGHAHLSDKLLGMLADEIPTMIDHENYLHALEACMSKLTHGQRELIEARYLPKNSLEMHARITGRKAPALRIALMRIRTALRECVQHSVDQKFA
jgi:RNA polymerase sigma-70 factor (ECF subfamily)